MRLRESVDRAKRVRMIFAKNAPLLFEGIFQEQLGVIGFAFQQIIHGQHMHGRKGLRVIFAKGPAHCREACEVDCFCLVVLTLGVHDPGFRNLDLWKILAQRARPLARFRRT